MEIILWLLVNAMMEMRNMEMAVTNFAMLRLGMIVLRLMLVRMGRFASGKKLL